MPRIPLQAFVFVLVVVRQGERFLLVQEAAVDRGSWFLPAGGVLPGEGLAEAAIRETREEAGIDVIPQALLWMEDTSQVFAEGLWAGRWRFMLRAEPADPHQTPHPGSSDTLDAGWFTLEEIARLPLRSPEVLGILGEAARGCPELPLEAGYRRPALE